MKQIQELRFDNAYLISVIDEIAQNTTDIETKVFAIQALEKIRSRQITVAPDAAGQQEREGAMKVDATWPHCNVNTADKPDAIRFYPDGQRECILCGSRWQGHSREQPLHCTCNGPESTDGYCTRCGNPKPTPVPARK